MPYEGKVFVDAIVIKAKAQQEEPEKDKSIVENNDKVETSEKLADKQS
mgnify:CR=1 FL=1